jgi:hypothetical protein
MLINSKDILYSIGSNDECMTLSYAVHPIIKYIKKDWTIWCPFDTKDSEFVKQISANGHKVIYSHIYDGKDFYIYEPNEKWDCIISNPPFTDKRLIFERALSFDKPFALIMSNTWLNDAAPKQLFRNKDLQLLMFDKRMRFYNNGKISNKITFSCSYFCYKFLPKQIIMEELNPNYINTE